MSTAIASAKRVYRVDIDEASTLAAHRGAVLKIFFPCLIVLATGLAFIWLQSHTEGLRRDNASLLEQTENQMRQLSNLRIDQERYTSRSEILKRVTEYQLDLRPPMVGQTRRVALRRQPVRQREEEGGLVARR